MRPLADARQFVLDSVPSPRVVEVDRRDALGLVLAAPIVAAEIVPPFDNTAVDGYAVRADDVAGADDAPVDLIV
ncbi:MAG: molybdopterin molybdenumtransferase MoeA, partial [Actinomycetota bacterium]